MLPKRLKKFLHDSHATYDVIRPHEIPDQPALKAKTFIFKTRDQHVMVVLPSTASLDPFKLRLMLEAESILLDSVEEMRALFPDCEPGAVPAIGIPYNIPCFVDETLLDGEELFFSGGNPEEAIRINSDEYWRVAQAEVGDFRKRG